MKRIFAALVVLLMSLGFTSAQNPCIECNVNSITQDDVQVIKNVHVAATDPIIFNEGVSAAVTVTPAYAKVTDNYYKAGFSKTEQSMTQVIDGLGQGLTAGVPGLFANKASQASWIENQGGKEKNLETGYWDYEGALVRQDTVQKILDITEYPGTTYKNGPEGIFNGDSKLAVISDNLLKLEGTVSVTAKSTDTAESSTEIKNNANVDANVLGDVTNIGNV